MELGGYSVIGPRGANEDNFYARDLTALAPLGDGITAFVMVSDGMGGYQSGDEASALAVAAAQDHLDALARMTAAERTDFDPKAAMAAIFLVADEAIRAAAAERGNPGMGATFTGAFVSSQHAWIGHVGDSRAFLVRGNTVLPYAANHPPHTGALGMANAVLETNETSLQTGDVLVLCTDGVYGTLDSDALSAAVGSSADATMLAKRITDAALQAGTTDNTTAAVASLRRRDVPDIGLRPPSTTQRMPAIGKQAPRLRLPRIAKPSAKSEPEEAAAAPELIVPEIAAPQADAPEATPPQAEELETLVPEVAVPADCVEEDAQEAPTDEAAQADDASDAGVQLETAEEPAVPEDAASERAEEEAPAQEPSPREELIPPIGAAEAPAVPAEGPESSTQADDPAADQPPSSTAKSGGSTLGKKSTYKQNPKTYVATTGESRGSGPRVVMAIVLIALLAVAGYFAYQTFTQPSDPTGQGGSGSAVPTPSSAQEPPQPTEPVAFIARENARVSFINADGKPESFSTKTLNILTTLNLQEGATVRAYVAEDDYGTSREFRALDESYIEDLKNDRALYLDGQRTFDTEFSQVVEAKRYRSFIAELSQVSEATVDKNLNALVVETRNIRQAQN